MKFAMSEFLKLSFDYPRNLSYLEDIVTRQGINSKFQCLKMTGNFHRRIISSWWFIHLLFRHYLLMTEDKYSGLFYRMNNSV